MNAMIAFSLNVVPALVYNFVYKDCFSVRYFGREFQ